MARYVRTRIWNAIGFYLSELPSEVSVGLLNGVVDMLSSLLSGDEPASSQFCSYEAGSHFTAKAITFISFTISPSPPNLLINSTEFQGIREMYRDLLELSRPNLYPRAIQDQALRPLLAQVGSRSTRHLLQALLQWPHIEVQLFISEFFSRFTLLAFRSVDDLMKYSVIRAYRNAVPQWNESSLVPLVEFLSQVVTLSERHCKSVMESGALDFMLHLYLTDFWDPLASQERRRTFRKSALLGACNHFLLVTLETKIGSHFTSSHPLSMMWSIHPVLNFCSEDSKERRWERRQRFWSTSSDAYIKWRVSSIFEIARDETKLLGDAVALDIVTDCFQLLGPEYPSWIGFRALRSLHEVITQSVSARSVRVRIWNALNAYIAGLPEHDAIGLLNHAVTMLSSLLYAFARTGFFDSDILTEMFRSGDDSVTVHFRFHGDRPTFVTDAIVHFIHCFTLAAERNNVREVILSTNLPSFAESSVELLRDAFPHEPAYTIEELSSELTSKEAVDLYKTHYDESTLHAPFSLHVLQWNVLLLKGAIRTQRRRLIVTPPTWWDPETTDEDANLDTGFLYDWLRE
ncbi:hypothetical protein VNI00_014604 [Paramarasmius palmivorus]|uniref:Uncharacterized protein n=1 Tax=Paramarasmius palmivorus TaxID=297713 RepID=A0AAW0BRP2_9AGAR